MSREQERDRGREEARVGRVCTQRRDGMGEEVYEIESVYRGEQARVREG